MKTYIENKLDLVSKVGASLAIFSAITAVAGATGAGVDVGFATDAITDAETKALTVVGACGAIWGLFVVVKVVKRVLGKA